jgi:metallo-beta-lactamase class B
VEVRRAIWLNLPQLQTVPNPLQKTKDTAMSARTARHQICLMFTLLAVPALAEDAAAIKAKLAADPALFLQVATESQHWNAPMEPAHVAGPIYFVGTAGLASWLITTSDGLILMNTGMEPSGPMIEASIRKLGFDPKDIQLLLTCHAHVDHVAGHAYIKSISGAKVAIADPEAELLASGGKIDYFYGGIAGFDYAPVTADIIFRDGDVLKLGDVAMTAQIMPGHSRGATTWSTNIVVDGIVYYVVFSDGSGINPGFRVQVDETYPGMGDDYRSTLHRLEMLRPDIWLTAHNSYDGFVDKLARSKSEGIAAWVDPEGYRQFVIGQRAAFEATVNEELGIAPVKQAE